MQDDPVPSIDDMRRKIRQRHAEAVADSELADKSDADFAYDENEKAAKERVEEMRREMGLEREGEDVRDDPGTDA